MSDDEKRKRGLEKFEQLMRFPAPDLRADAFVDCTMDHLFAEVCPDSDLAVRDRRLVTLTVPACLGNEMTMKLHFGAAMRSGDHSDDELDAVIVHLAHYAGWPTAAVLPGVVRRLRAER